MPVSSCRLRSSLALVNAEIVEAELGTGAVGDVAFVGVAASFWIHVRLDVRAIRN